MRALRGMVGIMLGLGLVLLAGSDRVSAANRPAHKVMIYPTPDETIGQLKDMGIQAVTDYGAYWLLEVTDLQMESLKSSRGDRVQKCNSLNLIELAVCIINTAVGEPEIPVNLREVAGAGPRLRLVQFTGFIQPQWIEKLKALGVTVVNFIPNSAYVVYLDAATEEKLLGAVNDSFPVQWVGAYHPYYKFAQELTKSDDAHLNVVVYLVDAPNAIAAEVALQQFNQDKCAVSYTRDGKRRLRMIIQSKDLPLIAKIPEVVWIGVVKPIKQKDEKQALIVSNLELCDPSFRPATTYFDFLAARGFDTAPDNYPIVDIADGLIAINREQVLPDFRELGDSGNPTRMGSLVIYSGINYPILPAGDRHANSVASILTGYSECNDIFPVSVLETRRYTQAVTIDPFAFIGGGLPEIIIAASPYGALCDPVTVDCTAVSRPVSPTSQRDVAIAITTPEGICVTNTFSVRNPTIGTGQQNPVCFTTNLTWKYDYAIIDNTVNQNGYFVRLGISPYGRFSNNAIFGTEGFGSIPATTGSSDDPIFVFSRNEYLTSRARIANYSWGTNADGDYDDLAQAIDAVVRDAVRTGSTNPPTPGPAPLNQELICVTAAGDENGFAGTGGFGDVLVSSPASGKNLISVGVSELCRFGPEVATPFPSDTDNIDDIAWFSSAGPTLDGRIKPEIVAPGTSVWTLDGQQLATYTGECTGRLLGLAASSYAAPAVSGAIQLLWWWFQQRLSMLQPSPAMAKAYVCNSAKYLQFQNPLTGAMDTLPSIAQGMGRLDLERMFDMVPRVLRDQSAPRAIDTPLLTTNPVTQQTYFNQSGQSYEVSGTVYDSTKPFRVTLAWTDVPGDPTAFKQLVNDLDLEVQVAGKIYKGNFFAGAHSRVGGNFDDINNLESVFLPPGQTGAWSVVVRAVNIAGQGVPNVGTTLNQDYALVVYNGANPSDAANLTTNDSCQTAIEIATYPFTWTNNLTPSVYHNNHPSPTAGRGGVEEFFTIAYPTPGTVLNANTFGSNFNTLLSVWRGTCGSLEEVISNNDASNSTQSAVSWTVTDTNIYYIVVEGLQNKTGKVVLNVSATAPPFGFTTALADFGSQYIGNSTNLTVTLLNQTAINANISDVTISGLAPEDYEIDLDNCKGATIPPGGTCNISILFAPTVVGTRAATLLVFDDITGSPHSLPLTGVGLAPVPLFCPNAIGSLAFGEVTTGVFSPERFLVITNCGTADLFITNAVVIGAASNDFVITTDICSGIPIAPSETCTIGLRFVPATTGVRTATLRINDNTTTSPHTVALSGTGRAPAPVVCLSPTSVNFANVPVGTTSVVTSVTVTNCGTAPLSITSVSVIGAGSNQFVLVTSDCVGGSIATGAACVVQLQFAPTSIGQATATLQFNDNAPGSPHTVALSGLGIGSQPDGQIAAKNKAKYYLGNNIINLTGDAQEAIQKGKRAKPGKVGKPRYFYVSVQNDGNTSDSYTVSGPTSLPGFASIRYFLGASPKQDLLDITGAVGAGTYTTASLAVGATTGDATLIRVEFIVDSLAVAGTQSFLMTLTSTSNPAKQDVVKATITVK